MQTHAEVQALGNEGFLLTAPGARIYIDALFGSIPVRVARPTVRPRDVTAAELILVTHGHWDHFDAKAVADVSRRTGATVVGPADVVAALEGRVQPEALVRLDPARASSQVAELRGVRVTAIGTSHGRRHNSYLVEAGGFRFFHDGDNEDTRPLDRDPLRPLDALMICPWQGSGWAAFIEEIAARHCFLMHLTDQELDEHEAGRFLPPLCPRPPQGLIGLRPGQSFVIPGPGALAGGPAAPRQEENRD